MELRTWLRWLDLEREMRSMFDRYWPAESGERSPRLMTDMHREVDELMVTVELSGIDPEKDLEVSVVGDALSIEREKADERQVEEENNYLQSGATAAGKAARRLRGCGPWIRQPITVDQRC